MNKNLKKKYEIKTKILKAMAHPTRLLIIEELKKGEQCVFDLVKLVGNDQSTISKHLSLMKNAGIIEDQKRGLNVFYKLRYSCIISCLKCIEQVEKQDIRRLKKIASL